MTSGLGPSELLSLGETGLIGLPGVEHVLTFGPGETAWQPAWERWCEHVLARILAPAMLECARHADRDHARELREVDLRLAAQFAPEALVGAREEGGRLLADLHGARSARWLIRLQAWATAGETPALFPTVFAARSALFHLPPRPMLFGYALLEWRAARRHLAPSRHLETGTPAEALAILRAPVDHLLRPSLAAA